MGTPEIAAVCLDRLYRTGAEIVGVYTKQDTPQKRGMKMTFSAVKETALAAGLPILQPASFRDEETIDQLRRLRPDLVVVVAYGKILPEAVLNIPPLGCVNIHASLLPALRGAAPVQRAVLAGSTETGVTAMYMARELDAGDIIDSLRCEIGPNETSGELMEKLSDLGAQLLCRTVARFAVGPVEGRPQDPQQVTWAPMLTRQESPIDWTCPASEIHNRIRGLNPWPVAETILGGKRLRIYASEVLDEKSDLAAGTPLGVNKKGLDMVCGDGSVLRILTVQADGGKRLAAPDYFRGHPLS